MTTKQKTTLFLSMAGAALGAALFLHRAAVGGETVHAIARPAAPAAVKKQRIQVALLLDTSSSMDGLLNQARTQMWSLVNELASSSREGVVPTLELALYEYGKPSLGADNGYIRQMAPLTTSLDSVSEALFALSTNGGDEYAGKVISDAVNELKWDRDPSTLKLIFIAGNEEFTQGPVDYHLAVKTANKAGIVVNTVYCGSPTDHDAIAWADGARLSQGRAMSIAQNAQVAHIAAPQDEEIVRLSAALNQTYLAFGPGGAAARARQSAQDSNAAPSPQATLSRAKTKAGKLYRNESWDLVDAKAAGVSVESIAEEDLPADLKAIPRKERAAYIEKKEKERSELKSKINNLAKERDDYVARQKPSTPDASTLDKAMRDAVREQAAKKGFVFKK